MPTNIKVKLPNDVTIDTIYTDMLSKHPIAFDVIELDNGFRLIVIVNRHTITVNLTNHKGNDKIRHVTIENILKPEHQDVLLHAKLVLVSYNNREVISVLSGGETGYLYLLPLTNIQRHPVKILKGHYSSITSICILKTTINRALTSSADCSVILWNLSTNSILYRFLDTSTRQLYINAIVC